MWVELQKIDGLPVQVRADRVLAVSACPCGKGSPLSWVHLVGQNEPISVQGAAGDLTRQIDKALQKRGSGLTS